MPLKHFWRRGVTFTSFLHYNEDDQPYLHLPLECLVMAEIVRSERQSHNHKWDRIKAKEGDDFSVTLNPKERALVFAMLSFAAAFPNFLIEYDHETQQDEVQAFLDGLTGKLA